LNAKVFWFEKLIGTAELHVGDEPMGWLYGEFVPTENYYQDIQPTVQKFTSSLDSKMTNWESLQLNVQLDNEYFLYAAGGITINDSGRLSNEFKQIDIAGANRHVIEDVSHQKEQRPFVVEPWEAVSVEQKIAFEKE
jgi:hypothetical protein